MHSMVGRTEHSGCCTEPGLIFLFCSGAGTGWAGAGLGFRVFSPQLRVGRGTGARKTAQTGVWVGGIQLRNFSLKSRYKVYKISGKKTSGKQKIYVGIKCDGSTTMTSTVTRTYGWCGLGSVCTVPCRYVGTLWQRVHGVV